MINLKIIKSYFSNPVTKNSLWIIFSSIYQMIASLIIGILSARYLGPENYGVLNFVLSIVALFLPVVSAGLQGVVINELLKSDQDASQILGSTFLIQIFSSIFSIIGIIIVVFILNPGYDFIITVAIIQSFSLLFKSSEVVDYWFQSRLQSKYTSLSKMITVSILAIYRLTIIILVKDIIWFAFATFLDSFIFAAVMFVLYIKKRGPRFKYDFLIAKNLLKNSYHFIISGLMVVIYTQMDKIMIGTILNAEKVGVYTSSVHITEMWLFFPTALIISARPTILSMKLQNSGKFIRYLESLYSLIIWSSFIVSIFVFIFSKPITLLLYGESYLSGHSSLRILIWSTGIAMIGTARSIWVVAEKKNKFVKKYLFWGMITNLIFNILFIPKLGITGAAYGTLLAQIVAVIISPLFYKETRIHTIYLINALLPLKIIKDWRQKNAKNNEKSN